MGEDRRVRLAIPTTEALHVTIAAMSSKNIFVTFMGDSWEGANL